MPGYVRISSTHVNYQWGNLIDRGPHPSRAVKTAGIINAYLAYISSLPIRQWTNVYVSVVNRGLLSNKS